MHGGMQSFSGRLNGPKFLKFVVCVFEKTHFASAMELVLHLRDEQPNLLKKRVSIVTKSRHTIRMQRVPQSDLGLTSLREWFRLTFSLRRPAHQNCVASGIFQPSSRDRQCKFLIDFVGLECITCPSVAAHDFLHHGGELSRQHAAHDHCSDDRWDREIGYHSPLV